jgi:hypothetical protein
LLKLAAHRSMMPDTMSSVVLVLGIIPSIRSSVRLVSGLPGTLPRSAIRQHNTQHQTREAGACACGKTADAEQRAWPKPQLYRTFRSFHYKNPFA